MSLEKGSSAACRFYLAFRRLNQIHGHAHAHAHAHTHTHHLLSPARAAILPLRRLLRYTHYETRYVAGNKQWHSTTATTTSSGPENEVLELSTHVRKLMRRIPHPVVVVTSSQPAVEKGGPLHSEAGLRAMTVSSFNTVALDPAPIVSFNVRTPSSSFDALSSRGTFLVHFIASTPAGVQIADAFTKGRAGKAFEDLAKARQVTILYGPGTDGAPLLTGAGVTRVLRCRYLRDKSVKVGDHMIVLGEVLGVIGPALGADIGDAEDEPALIYVDRQYRECGGVIPVPTLVEAASKEQIPMQRTLGLNLRAGDER